MTRLESRKRPLSIWVVKLWIGNPKEVEKMYTQESNNKTGDKGHDTRCIRVIEKPWKRIREATMVALENLMQYIGFTLRKKVKCEKKIGTHNVVYTHTLAENVSNLLLKQFICTKMQSVTMIPKMYVLGCVNWFLQQTWSREFHCYRRRRLTFS